MIDTLYSADKLDFLIKTKLNDTFDDLNDYVFEGDDYNKINFHRLLVFFNDRLFEKASLDIKPLARWINAYYWYSTYINELKRQGISIENHRQSRSKLLEQIDYVSDSSFDWSIIEKIDNKYDLK